jgi:alanyl aminopeptidase
VTTAWWDDIWLNEAFASWIAEKTVDRWRPDYHRGAARVDERARAIEVDALASARKIRQPVLSRGDVSNAFDRITYEKGATVIGMFEAWIGEEPFRLGVRNYLEARRNGSATSADFLDALGKASMRPVAPAFDTFLNQGGIPLVDASVTCGKDGAKLALAQRRLTLMGAAPSAPQRWQIPVCAKVGGGASSTSVCTLLTEVETSIPIGGACPAYVFANAGGRGYYVANYRDGALDRIERHRGSLSPAELASLLDDIQALVRAGAMTHAQARQWIRHGAASRDRNVMRAAVSLAEFEERTGVADGGKPRSRRSCARPSPRAHARSASSRARARATTRS